MRECEPGLGEPRRAGREVIMGSPRFAYGLGVDSGISALRASIELCK